MKYILFTIVALVAGITTSYAQNDNYDYIFLKNGNIVKGVIENIEDNHTITIRSAEGDIYTYPMIEVNKITYKETPKIPQEKGLNSYKEYREFDKGFWFAVELQGGISFLHEKENVGIMELDFTGGYRFNEYLHTGLGLGLRYYLNNEKLRYSSVQWAYPIYLNIRGNIIPCEHRTIVPYYSFDIGYAIKDGVLMRPTIGVRIGEKRSVLLLGLSYMGQSLKSYKINNDNSVVTEKLFSSFFTLKIGYEF